MSLIKDLLEKPDSLSITSRSRIASVGRCRVGDSIANPEGTPVVLVLRNAGHGVRSMSSFAGLTDTPDSPVEWGPTTDGEIAAINLESARAQSWSRFWQAPLRPGIAEYIVEQEQLAAQFLGDLGALDRLATLVDQLTRVDPQSARTGLISAQVASMAHRFADARACLSQAEACGAPLVAARRLSLSIDQACGTDLDAVLDARRRIATESGRLEDLVPLGALLADLREFDEAGRIYLRALREYQNVSPFAVAWVCFQLGVLWGELAPEPQPGRAAQWYRKAIACLPRYVKARVHLAEICLRDGNAVEAEALLFPAVSSADPEVCWRLADVMNANGRFADAQVQMLAARCGFELLLEKHLLAFADHGAEFYAGSGNDPARALELATVNLANRPTLRAFEQAHTIAIGTGETHAAAGILAAARKRWGATSCFSLSTLALHGNRGVENQACS
jgi:tetratricopeptide (TPR) repeat protein